MVISIYYKFYFNSSVRDSQLPHRAQMIAANGRWTSVVSRPVRCTATSVQCVQEEPPVATGDDRTAVVVEVDIM